MQHQSLRTQVRDAAGRLFADLEAVGAYRTADRANWQPLEDCGFDRLLVDDPDGEGWPCAASVFRHLGYHGLAVPLRESTVARGLLRRAGADADLPGPLTLAVLDGTSVRFETRGAQLGLAGGALTVPWARTALHAVVAGMHEGEPVLAVLPLRNPAPSLRPGQNTAGEPRDLVATEPWVSTAWHRMPPGSDARGWAALATACAMVGASQRVLELSLKYAEERVQFGRPIGKFQVLQHSLALLACEIAAATMAVEVACSTAQNAEPTGAAAVAKVRAGQAAGTAAAVGHQVHGAIGFTDEHRLHHLTRRLWSWRREGGTERDWALALGRQTLLAGAEGAWPLVVQLSTGAEA